jgi:DNA-binding transcriptional LysR family regulator
MHLRSVDLNLLVVLDAVLEEAHVSRAAMRLGLSQPATSSALDRCRQLFADPLLERAGAGMRLTHKAEGLRGPLRDLLEETRALLTPTDTPLDRLQQSVRLVMGDFPAMLLAPPLVGRLAATAPGVDLVLQNWRGAERALEALGRGDADLALSVFPAVEPDFYRESLLDEHYVVAMRRGHPAEAGFDLDRWLAYPHVMVSGEGRTRGPLDGVLAKIGRSRRVAMVAPSFALVPKVLAASDLIAMLPSQVAAAESEVDLAVFDPPLPVEGFTLHLAWRHRRGADPGVAHVAALIRSLAREILAA